MRDYVNEGGKLLVAGESNRLAEGQDGVYDYNPFAPPECTTPDTYPCLPVLNDFLQYWLGAYTYVDDGGTDADGEPVPARRDRRHVRRLRGRAERRPARRRTRTTRRRS